MNKETEEDLLKDNDQISASENDLSQVKALQSTPQEETQ
jgi:chemotaxis protein MotB